MENNGSAKFNLKDKKFGRWKVLEYNGGSYWKCLCDCGKIKMVDGNSLRRGLSKSCGCLHKEIISKMGKDRIRHGRSNKGDLTYTSWQHMKRRVLNKNSPDFPNWGGRGIKVCERWIKFENFLEDMGERPEGMTLDRIDNDGNYEPSNCKWSTRKEQNRNKRNIKGYYENKYRINRV